MAERKTFLLRIDSELWKQLENWAQEELRSVNGQMEYILKQAVSKRYDKQKKGKENKSDHSDFK